MKAATPHIIIYTGSRCPFCVRAKKLLDLKGVNYEEVSVDNNIQARETMIERTEGRRTVPQIFIGYTFVGGCDDLYALNETNALDALLHPSE